MEESKELDEKDILSENMEGEDTDDEVSVVNEDDDMEDDEVVEVDEEEDEDDDEDEDDISIENQISSSSNIKKGQANTGTLSEMLKYNELNVSQPGEDIDVESTDDEDDEYLQKLNNLENESYIMSYHPEAIKHNFDEVIKYSKVVRNNMGNIIDPYHKTLDKLTKYEKAKILGQRAKQLDHGAKSFVNVDPSVVDGYLIALEELQQKKLPFIIRRPLPNGGFEYWPVSELEVTN